MVPGLQWFDLWFFNLTVMWKQCIQEKLYFKFCILISFRTSNMWYNTLSQGWAVEPAPEISQRRLTQMSVVTAAWGMQKQVTEISVVALDLTIASGAGKGQNYMQAKSDHLSTQCWHLFQQGTPHPLCGHPVLLCCWGTPSACLCPPLLLVGPLVGAPVPLLPLTSVKTDLSCGLSFHILLCSKVMCSLRSS